MRCIVQIVCLAIGLLHVSTAMGLADHPKPWSQADAYYDAEDMAAASHHVQRHHGGTTGYLIAADRLEYQVADDVDTFLWDLQGWYGGDVNKLLVKSEGDYSFSENAVEEAEVQALWSRAVSPFFNIQAGVRGDFEPDDRIHGVFGVWGTLPYGFEVDSSAFVSGQGDVTARIEVEYEVKVTQRVGLEPRLEVELSAQDIPELDVGAGVAGFDLGVRVHYELRPEIAPYIGVEWQASFGDTADIARTKGEDPRQTVFVVGISVWF